MGILRRTFLAGIGLAAIATSPAVSAETLLRMNHQMAPNTAGSIVDAWFAEEVGKRTGNAVKIRIFFSNGLGQVKETLSLLESGAVDMAGLSPGFFPDQLPFFTAPNSIPMAMTNIDQAYLLNKRLLAEVPAFMEEARSKGIRPLFFHVLNPYLLVSKEPITTVEGMKGRKFRTWGADMPRLAQAVGAVPVTLGTSEIYEGLMRGVVDAIPFSLDLVRDYKINETAKHVSDITLWEGPTWGVWISEKAWAKLTPDQQTAVTALADEAAKRDLEAVRQAETDARKFLLEKGVTIHKFAEAEQAKWKAALPDFFAEWIEKMAAKGKGDDAKKTVAIWKEVVASTPGVRTN